MKFRGVMIENAAMRDFQNVTLSLSRFAKSCVLRLAQRNVYFIVSEEDGGPRHPLVWCELPVSFYFKEYNVVGVTDEQNEIYLDLSTVLLARSCSVLKQEVKCLKIKLTNKDSPCLTLDMELASGELSGRQCVHDIPVTVISRKHWPDYEQPTFDEFHVSIQMPNLKAIKSIVEKMKNLSHTLTVAATKCGELTLEISTSTVKLSAHFLDLNVKSFAGLHLNEFDSNITQNNTISSTVDLKKFLTFLSGMQLNNCQAVCNIVKGKMVKLFMEQPGVLLMQIFLTQLSV